MEARLTSPTDISGFRTEARNLLAHQIAPEDVQWDAPAEASRVSVAAKDVDGGHAKGGNRSASSIVPASFARLCEYVVQHRDPERFALLYRLLWRLVHEPELRHDPADADMARAQHMAHAVRRDIHKLKTHLSFREVPDPARPGSVLGVAWCEPAHHILETVAPWLAKRYAGRRWTLMTPERSAYWDGKQLRYSRGSTPPLPAGASDGDWLARWRELFA